jgi:hypothetical protein
VHPHQPGDDILMKTWSGDKFELCWESLSGATHYWDGSAHSWEGMIPLYLGKKSSIREIMDSVLKAWQYQNYFKTAMKGLLFFFHSGSCMYTVNVTETTAPITIRFTACLVLPCGELLGQCQFQAKNMYMCVQSTPVDGLYLFLHGWTWAGSPIRVGELQLLLQRVGQ